MQKPKEEGSREEEAERREEEEEGREEEEERRRKGAERERKGAERRRKGGERGRRDEEEGSRERERERILVCLISHFFQLRISQSFQSFPSPLTTIDSYRQNLYLREGNARVNARNITADVLKIIRRVTFW